MSARRFDVAIVAYENGDAETISSRSPLPDRLALARALAPDGWVVARVPDERRECRAGFDEAVGWNACRAEVLASGEAGR